MKPDTSYFHPQKATRFTMMAFLTASPADVHAFTNRGNLKKKHYCSDLRPCPGRHTVSVRNRNNEMVSHISNPHHPQEYKKNQGPPDLRPGPKVDGQTWAGGGGANEAQVGRNNLIHIDPHRLEGGRKRTNPPKSNQRTTTTHQKKKKRHETNR